MKEITIEQALLGIILMYPEVVNKIHASTDDFQDPKNRKIYETMGLMEADGEKIDLVTVSHKLPNLSKYLSECTNVVLIKHDYQHYDKIIREESAKNKALLWINALSKLGNNGSSAQEILEKSQEMIRVLSEKLGSSRSLAARIDDWLANSQGTFFGTEMDKELGIGTNRDKENRKKILQRLEKKGRLVKASNRQGHYRIVDDALEVIDYKAAPPDQVFSISWPFGIEDLVNILPKSIIICAGAWESGKTAFLLNVARMNMHKHKVRYMSSEMGEAEFALRLRLFVDIAPNDWRIEAIERSSDWEDAIIPNGINIIDYLELSDAFYSVGDKIRKIFDRLNQGIAIIALQKVIGKDLGRGGDFTAEKARLYLSLDPGELTIIKGKLWANPQVSPKNMCRKFKLWQGHKFVPEGEWFKKIKTTKENP